MVQADRTPGSKSTTAPATVSGERCSNEPLWKRGKVGQSSDPQVRRPARQETYTHAVGSGGKGDHIMKTQTKVAVQTQRSAGIKVMALSGLATIAIALVTSHLMLAVLH